MEENLNYFNILPATQSFRGGSPLTYSSKAELGIGEVVNINFRDKDILGIVLSRSEHTDIETKEAKPLDTPVVLPSVSYDLLRSSLDYYPGYLGATGQSFAPSFLNNFSGEIKKDNKKKSLGNNDLPSLTPEQKNAIDSIRKSESTSILHGDTGSGKTRVYIELSEQYLSSGKSVLILTPEISLTTPLYQSLKNVFGDIVSINHSSLSPKKRLEIWTKLYSSKQPSILIGPRSSLFMPSANLGLIIVDEFHESTYKQESAPFYNAVRMASILAQKSKSKLVLGSATPPIGEYFLAKNKNTPIIRMHNQAITNKPRSNKSWVIDLSDKEERSPFWLISNTLLSLIDEELKNKRQSLLFINKRGSARTIACQNCGWRYLCKNCDLPLVYHSDQQMVRCHTCGLKNKLIHKCPECNSTDILFKNPGTKMIVEQLKSKFPSANIVRFDKDNKKSERLENNYKSIKDGSADIIVGTQLLIKGHDLPNLGLAAMLQADSTLNFPDFSSEERSYQMVKQLAGRVGRGHTSGKVIIQTFDPNNPVISMALSGNWQDFYNLQIKQREQLGFPPFCHALKIETSRKSRGSAITSINKIDETLRESYKNISILGPSPSFIEKKQGMYSWQIIVRSKNRNTLVEILSNLKGFKGNIDPSDFL